MGSIYYIQVEGPPEYVISHTASNHFQKEQLTITCKYLISEEKTRDYIQNILRPNIITDNNYDDDGILIFL